MKLAALLRRAACLVAVLAPLAGAQSWRETSAGLGATMAMRIDQSRMHLFDARTSLSILAG